MNQLPTTLPCPTCQQEIAVDHTDYIGIFQKDTLTPGQHGYNVHMTCPMCKVTVVKRVLLDEKAV